jgi:hypothetical protein
MPGSGDPTLDQLLAGIREQETGGEKSPYTTVNSIGALGAYQVMTENVASWTKEALGHSLTKAQFLASPADQDATARYIIGGYYSKYGAKGAAAMWYSGQPDPTKTYGNPPVYSYVNDVIASALKAGKGITGTGPANAAPTGDSIFSWPSDVVNFFKAAYADIESTANFFAAFFRPSTYVRIGAGFFGTVFIILGIICLALETREA